MHYNDYEMICDSIISLSKEEWINFNGQDRQDNQNKSMNDLVETKLPVRNGTARKSIVFLNQQQIILLIKTPAESVIPSYLTIVKYYSQGNKFKCRKGRV